MLNLSVCFPEELLVDYIENNDNNVVIELRSNQSFSLCPCCRVKSKQIHSYYNRALSDIPIINQKVVIRLQTRKFFCNNRKCSRSIFTERYNTLIKAYARRTDRLNKFLEEIAFATSAETAAKIITNNIQEISADTVIRIVQNTEIKVNSDYEAIGIDDFAFKKGNNYGTLVCDLKTNKPIAVIKDRDCSTVSNWLENYKQIKYVSRDRSSSYESAVKNVIPNAIQIADRFHLLHNLSFTLMNFIKLKYTNGLNLKNCLNDNLKQGNKLHRLTQTQATGQENYQKKWELILEVQDLHKTGIPKREIARILSLARGTINNYLKMTQPPQRVERYRKSKLGPYESQIADLINKKRSSVEIFKIIKQGGYKGSYNTVTHFVSKFKNKATQKNHKSKNLEKRVKSRKLFSLLFINPKKLNDEDKTLLSEILEDSLLSKIYSLIQDFKNIISEKKHTLLNEWINNAINIEINEFISFAEGIKKDLEYVKNALIFKYSNGVLEGHINRVKCIKRSMYGRASFELLSKKILYQYAA